MLESVTQHRAETAKTTTIHRYNLILNITVKIQDIVNNSRVSYIYTIMYRTNCKYPRTGKRGLTHSPYFLQYQQRAHVSLITARAKVLYDDSPIAI